MAAAPALLLVLAGDAAAGTQVCPDGLVYSSEKRRTECISEFGVAYMQKGEGAAQNWLSLLEPFAIAGAAGGPFQPSCKSEKCDGMSI